MHTNKTYNNVVLKSMVICNEVIPSLKEKVVSIKQKVVSFCKEKVDSIKESFFAAKMMVSMMLA